LFHGGLSGKTACAAFKVFTTGNTGVTGGITGRKVRRAPIAEPSKLPFGLDMAVKAFSMNEYLCIIMDKYALMAENRR
jgi:hypothetical protein